MTIQTKDADGSVVQYPATAPLPRKGYTIRQVDAIPARAAGDTTNVLRWVDPAGLTWVAPVLTPQQQFNAAVAAGYTVPGIEPPLVLDLSDGARAQFTGLKVLLDSLMAGGQLLGTSTQAIADKAGALHSLPVSQIDQVLLGYGLFYANLYNTLHAALTAPAPAAG